MRHGLSAELVDPTVLERESDVILPYDLRPILNCQQIFMNPADFQARVNRKYILYGNLADKS